MTWDGSTRRSRLPAGWSSSIQPRILARDGHRCYRCGGRATEVDHVRRGDDHSDGNLAAICESCHKAKTAAEANAVRWAKDRMVRPPERHPGLVRPGGEPPPPHTPRTVRGCGSLYVRDATPPHGGLSSAIPDTGDTDMPPGPLPTPTRRRRNAPTIPTTHLPAGGFAGPYPRPPKWVTLGTPGAAWWHWAWRTPQAAGWSSGSVDVVATRASLVDDLAALDRADDPTLADIVDSDETAVLLRRLLSMATGRLSVEKHMLDLDDRLGLTPKGLAALRWEIVATAEAAAETATDEVTRKRDDRRSRLSAS